MNMASVLREHLIEINIIGLTLILYTKNMKLQMIQMNVLVMTFMLSFNYATAGYYYDSHHDQFDTSNIETTHSEVSKHVPVPVIEKVPVAIPHPVPVQVPNYIRIQIPEPYAVHIPVNQEVEVPVYKVVPEITERRIPYPVEKPYPVEVERPYPVEVIKRIEIPIPKPYAVPVTIYKHILQHEKSSGWY